MKKNKIISAVICILMVLTLLCGCQDSKKYPTECKESPSQTEEQVLWPSYEQADVLSDGNLALVDFTHKDTFNKLGYKAKINTHTTSYIN